MQASVVGELPRALSDAAVERRAGAIVVAGGESGSGAAQRAVLTVAPLVRTSSCARRAEKALARSELAALDELGYAGACGAPLLDRALRGGAAPSPGCRAIC